MALASAVCFGGVGWKTHWRMLEKDCGGEGRKELD